MSAKDSQPGDLGSAGRSLARIAGATAGGFVGVLLGPEAGAAAGQALVESVDRFGNFLTARAQQRLESVSELTRAELERRLAGGDSLRADGLLGDTDAGDEASADILQGILRAAIDAQEARKCEVIANLGASIAVDTSISYGDALRLLRLVRDLSWRQLVALAYFEDEARETERVQLGARGEEGDFRLPHVLQAELSEMARTLELIGVVGTKGEVSNPSNTWGGGDLAAADLQRISTTELGNALAGATRLSSVVKLTDLDGFRDELVSDRAGAPR